MVGPVLNAKKALTKESSIITAIVVLWLCSWLSLLTISELNEITTPTTNTKWVNTDYWSVGNNRVKFLQASGHFFFWSTKMLFLSYKFICQHPCKTSQSDQCWKHALWTFSCVTQKIQSMAILHGFHIG